MAEFRTEVPTQADVHEEVKSLTRAIKHAKIECEASNYDSSYDDDDERLLKNLDSLKTAIHEYSLALKERRYAKRASCTSRDSGISLDRYSGTLRDSIPIQESGDFSELPALAISSGPTVHSDHNVTDCKKKIDDLSSSELQSMNCYTNYRSGRRPTNERRRIESISENPEN